MPPNNNQQPQQESPQQSFSALPQDLQTPNPTMPQQPIIQSGASGSAPKKSSNKKIIGIIIGVLLIIVIPIILLLIFMVFGVLNSGRMKSGQASNGFMGAITAGDTATALTYTDGSDEAKKLIERIAPSVKATTLSQKESAEQSGKWYYLYSLQGATSNTARTELEKSKDTGRWLVTGFYAGDNLALIPTASNNTDTKSTTELSNSGQCLVQSDFDNWYKEEYGVTATEKGLNFHKTENMYTTNLKFNADSLDYTDTAYNASIIKSLANLAGEVSGKTYVIRLQGSVATTSQTDLDFANKRAEKVKSDLITKGVPVSNIQIGQPSNVSDISGDPSQANDVTKSQSRNVIVKFDPTCSGSSSSSSDGR